MRKHNRTKKEMKRILLSLFAAVVAIPAAAQLDRSIRPEPGPASEPEIAEFKEYKLDNGITLIVVEDHKLPRVSMQLLLDIDPLLEGEKAGVTSIAGDMLSEGTVNRTKEQLDEEVDYMGARLSTSSRGAYVAGLSKYNESLMGILADVVLNPSFNEESFDKLKELSLTNEKSAADNPSALISNLWQSRIYGLDHAFGELQTEETLENITLQDCKNYYSTYFKPNVTYIAIVGDIKPRKARKLVEEYFSDWEMGEVPTNEIAVPELPAETYIALIDRPASVQSEIRIGNRVVLPRESEDLAAVTLANMILGGGSSGRLYLNLREEKSLTYGAYSSVNSSQYVSAFAAQVQVRNDVTDSAVAEILYEINRIRTEPVTAQELRDAKNYLAGSFGRSLESAQTVASFALNVLRFNLDEDYYNEYLQRLEAVTIEDVQAAAQKYFQAENLTIAVVGKASDIEGGLEKFGEVLRFDRYGMPASAAAPVPAGLTATEVLSTYHSAIGGEERLSQVSTYKVELAADLGNGMKLNMTKAWMKSGAYLQMFVAPMGVQKLVVNNDEVHSYQNGQEAPLTEDEAEELKAGANVFEFTTYSAEEMTLQPNVVEVNGATTYAVDITEAGSVTTHYFDAETGLRVRESATQETPQGPITQSVDYGDYREVNGVKIPYSMTMTFGPQSFEFVPTSVLIDSEDVTGELFK